MSDNVALSWNRAALEAVRQTRMGPPIAARALHVAHAAMYDAWAAHHDRALGSRLGDHLRRPPAERSPRARRGLGVSSSPAATPSATTRSKWPW